jgi:CRISPR-associated protein Cas2
MLIVIANDLPPAVRGRMKLWFVEPKPNVFVSGIKDHLAKEVVEYLHTHCPVESGLLIIRRIRSAPGYELTGKGDLSRKFVSLSGLQLVRHKSPARQSDRADSLKG